MEEVKKVQEVRSQEEVLQGLRAAKKELADSITILSTAARAVNDIRKDVALCISPEETHVHAVSWIGDGVNPDHQDRLSAYMRGLNIECTFCYPDSDDEDGVCARTTFTLKA